MADVDIPAGTLDAVRSALAGGRTSLEDTASSVPGTVDGGEATAVLMSLLASATESAAEVSTLLQAVHDQVEEAGAAFWESDTESAGAFAGAGAQGSAPR